MKFVYMDSTMEHFELYDALPKKFPPIMLTTSFNEKNSTYIIWNDDASNGNSKPSYDKRFAHSKGFLSFNDTEGIFVTHSLPRFPLRDENETILEDFASNVGYYGQAFFCMSIYYSEVRKIIDALRSVNVQILLYNIKDEDHHIKENIMNLVNKEFIEPTSDHINVTTIYTRKQLSVDLFIKSTKSDLPWDFKIPSYYKDSFKVETWV
jgi:hypothetical protein